jgi:oxygen-dependent protoporphyrinogen oxidase
MALEPIVPHRDAPGDESVASFFRRRFGPETVDLIAQPLLGGIHAGDIEQLSMRSLFPRLLDLERDHGSVITGLRAASGEPGAVAPGVQPSIGEIKGFASLRGGMGTLVRALEDRLPAGTIRTDAPVWHLDEIRTAREPVILAAPAFVAASLLAPIDEEGVAPVRPGALRLHRQRRARLAARGHLASARRHRLRRRAPAQRRPHHRVHVGVVEVGVARA